MNFWFIDFQAEKAALKATTEVEELTRKLAEMKASLADIGMFSCHFVVLVIILCRLSPLPSMSVFNARNCRSPLASKLFVF